MSAAGSESGVTLLEMLVVIGLMTLITMIAAPNFEQALTRMQLRETAGALQANLRVVRGDAIRSDQPIKFSLSSDGRSYSWSEGETRKLPGQIVLKGHAILFYGDGTTTGGTLLASSEGREISVVVDKATGAVATGP
jgi:Tfp pilus assembly protein FimT